VTFHVRLYSRPACSLCDRVREVIERVGRRAPIALEEVNIDEDPELRREYDAEVPVVEVDGREIARYHLTEERLAEALGIAASGAGGHGTRAGRDGA
jgi:glutaredoxin